jgi:hypothetical protein
MNDENQQGMDRRSVHCAVDLLIDYHRTVTGKGGVE